MAFYIDRLNIDSARSASVHEASGYNVDSFASDADFENKVIGS